MRDPNKLRAFQLADQLALGIYEGTEGFPRKEVFGLESQMRRAAVSIASNIVEGCARHTEADYLRFLDMAYGSASELGYQITLAKRLGYMREGESVTQLCAETCRVLNGLISSLRARNAAPGEAAVASASDPQASSLKSQASIP